MHPDAEELILAHASTPYDPNKRRERYLRNRQLKGRTKGSGDLNNGRPSAKVTPTKPNLADQHRREAEARVAALKVRLERLKQVLEQLVAEAKKRSGVEPKTDTKSTSSSSASKSSSKDDSKATPKEKRDAAERWKEYKKKHPDASSSSSGSSSKSLSPDREAAAVEANIKEVRAQIAKIREQLKASIEKARSTSSKSETAANGR